MKRYRIYLSDSESKYIEDNYKNISAGVREAVRTLQDNIDLKEYRGELKSTIKSLSNLLAELDKKTNNLVVEDYISYLHYYASNRGLHLPNRIDYFSQGGRTVLEGEKNLSHALRKNEAYLYSERKKAELKYNLDFEKYNHAQKENKNRKYYLDLVLFTYDLRAVFIFLTDVNSGKKIKLRTMKKHFIDTLVFIKPGSSIYLSTIKNERGYLEIIELGENRYDE